MTEQLALIPDPGEPRHPHVPAPAVEGSWVDTALSVAASYRPVAIAAAIALATLVILWAVNRLIRRIKGEKSPAVQFGGNKLRKVLVYLAASIGSGFTITSMWNAFDHKLHIDNIFVRIVLCAVFEIMILASAVNSRAFRIKRAAEHDDREEARKAAGETDKPTVEQREIDVDGIATWVFAVVSAWICYSDSTNSVEAAMRGFLPIGVAWMWERAIAADLRTFTRTVRSKKINLRISTERILVFLRLAEPTGRDVSDVDRARYRSAFTVAAFKLHTRRADEAWQWRIDFARWRLRRAGLAIMKRSGVAELMAAQKDVATLYGIEDFTAPDAVEHLAAWKPRVIDGTVTDDGDGQPVTSEATTVTGDVLDGEVVTEPSSPVTAVTVTSPVTPVPVSEDRYPSPVAPTVTVTPSPSRTVTSEGDAPATTTVTPSPRRAVTSGRNVKVAPLSRDLIDAQFRSWSRDQIEDYAAQRAKQAVADSGKKVDGLREYFLTCLALGIDPVGAQMARAIDASEGLARKNTPKWYGELAVADAEQILMDAHNRLLAEMSSNGDGDE